MSHLKNFLSKLFISLNLDIKNVKVIPVIKTKKEFCQRCQDLIFPHKVKYDCGHFSCENCADILVDNYEGSAEFFDCYMCKKKVNNIEYE